jgi:CelD/BcsL family acetyltransferase involved in cellulose biosynthesis
VAESLVEVDDGLPDPSLWSALADRADHPFARPEWLVPHAELLDAGVRSAVFHDDATGEATAVVLLCDRADGTCGFVGERLTDILGPVGAPGDVARAVEQLIGAVDRIAPGRPFVGAELRAPWVPPLEPPWESSVTPAPVVEVGGLGWEEYLQAPGARRRRRIAATTDRLLASGSASIDDHTTPAELATGLPLLVALHRARFGDQQRTFDGPRGEFFDRALRGLAATGDARIRVLRIDGEPAAAMLVLHGGGADWFYQSGRDPRFDAWAPGRALFADTVRQAFERGRAAFHLLRGDEPYKSWWATRTDQLITITRP